MNFVGLDLAQSRSGNKRNNNRALRTYTSGFFIKKAGAGYTAVIPKNEVRCLKPRGSQSGVNDHSTQHPIREQSLSSQPSQKTQKLSTQMKNRSHASRIPSPNQSPSCHSAEC
ncbi:hypothetical protein TNCV_3526201 [Trichonephila clavipes]|nr:hypothetical protein TNCV_3526201 [Trichonephila clavipes]